MTTIRIKLPKIEQCEFKISIENEYSSIEGAFASGDDEFDKKMVKDIEEQLDNGNQWAWCWVNVKCLYKGLTGVDSLGACSYKDEADFKEPGGYYDDMKQAAYDDLIQQIKNLKA